MACGRDSPDGATSWMLISLQRGPVEGRETLPWRGLMQVQLRQQWTLNLLRLEVSLNLLSEVVDSSRFENE